MTPRRRALLALGLAAAGLVLHSLTTGLPLYYLGPALVVPLAPPAAAALGDSTRARRPVGYAAAGLHTLLAVATLAPWGFGRWQLPAAAALWWYAAGVRG